MRDIKLLGLINILIWIAIKSLLMEHRLIFLLVGFLYLLMLGTCQVLPYYSASKYFYANEATAIVGSGGGIYSIPATFPISTASHRLPFYAVMSASNLKTELDEFMYFWT